MDTNFLDDWSNTELCHEHLFFEDEKAGDLGYGPKGQFSGENKKDYKMTDCGYDDCIMRKAVDAMKWEGTNYKFMTNNCQDWSDAVFARSIKNSQRMQR